MYTSCSRTPLGLPVGPNTGKYASHPPPRPREHHTPSGSTRPLRGDRAALPTSGDCRREERSQTRVPGGGRASAGGVGRSQGCGSFERGRHFRGEILREQQSSLGGKLGKAKGQCRRGAKTARVGGPPHSGAHVSGLLCRGAKRRRQATNSVAADTEPPLWAADGAGAVAGHLLTTQVSQASLVGANSDFHRAERPAQGHARSALGLGHGIRLSDSTPALLTMKLIKRLCCFCLLHIDLPLHLRCLFNTW